MSALAALQRAFQRAVLQQDLEVLDAIDATSGATPAVRLSIYQEAYRLRLEDALASNYPRLRQLIGEQAFATIAAGYIVAHPSTHASIRWVGGALESEFSRVFPTKPWLAELARWEWAMTEAFDATDASPLGAEALGAFAAEDWPQLRFGFHPSLRRLRTYTNAPALFKSLDEGQPSPDPAQLGEPSEWIIWRQDLSTCYRSLDDGEAAALDTLMGDGSFESMCMTLCNSQDEEYASLRAAQLLRQWFDESMVCNVSHG